VIAELVVFGGIIVYGVAVDFWLLSILLTTAN